MVRTTLMLVLFLHVEPAAAQLIDPKTNEYTSRGVIASMIAAAQVSEMRCGMKDQIKAALAKASRLGTPLDLTDRNDFSDVVFLATQMLSALGDAGADAWCKDKAPSFAKFLQSPE